MFCRVSVIAAYLSRRDAAVRMAMALVEERAAGWVEAAGIVGIGCIAVVCWSDGGQSSGLVLRGGSVARPHLGRHRDGVGVFLGTL